MGAGADLLVMAKPGGPRCNMRCTYCYYLGKEAVLPKGSGRMPRDLLERYISQRMASAPGPVAHFEWHGGEPTLLGLDYFREIVRLERACRRPGLEVSNGLQTNGLLLNGAWAGFLAREEFSVGLSLDGPAACHDAFRTTVDGEPTHARVHEAFRLLARHGVFVNLLCVLNSRTAADPDGLYEYFGALGATHLQFLPLVGGTAAADAEDIGSFLCRVFDLWIARDVGRFVIQNIDEALRPIYGFPHALCVHRETCGDAVVLERDGGFYSCDHFVDPGHLIGNLRDRSLLELAGDPRQLAFGRAKRDELPRACLECEVLPSCNGGCPKDRASPAPGEAGGLNRLCAAYKAFFAHVRPELSRLADHMKSGRRLREFKPAAA